MNSKYKVLISNTAIFAIGNILVKLISFFLMPLYTSVLTASQYGVAELLNNTIEIVLPLATLCMIEALYRFSIDRKVNHRIIFANSLAIITIGDVVVAVACIMWHNVFHYKYAYYFLLLYITTTFYKLTTQFARGLGHVKRYVLYGVVNSLLLVISNVVLLLWFNGGIASYLTSFSIGYGLTGIVALLLSGEYHYISLKQFDANTLKKMLCYSLPNIPNMLSWWVNSLSDRYIVLAFWGSDVAGLYTAASKLPALINVVTSIFQQAWQYSTATEISSRDNRKFFSNVFRVYAYLCVLACSVLILMNKFICNILLQSDFYLAWKFVPLLLLSATFGCIATYFGTFYNAIMNNTMLMVSTLVGAVGNIILNFVLIPPIGAMGAAIATTISYAIVLIIRMRNITKTIEININYKRFVAQMFLLSGSAIIGLFNLYCGVVVNLLIVISLIMTDIEILRILLKQIIKILISIRKELVKS